MDPVEMLMEMVSISTPSGEEAPLARFLVDTMTTMGLDAHIDAVGNSVGIIGDGPRDLVLLGHMDTVPGGPPIDVRDGKLYGRGAVDAKGPLATFIQAVARGPIDGVRLVVIGAVEEEAPSSKGAHYAAVTFSPEACVIGEPSGFDGLTLGYKGFLHLAWEWSRETAHTSGPELSSAERVFEFWSKVMEFTRRFNEGRTALYETLQATIRSIHTTVEDDCEVARATMSFRLPPHISPDELETSVNSLEDQGASLQFSGAMRAWRCDRSNPLVTAFNQMFHSVGTRPHYKYKTGTSDMNVLGPAWRCPIVAYGPGDAHLDHTPHEHIVIDEYLHAIERLRLALEKWSTISATRSKATTLRSRRAIPNTAFEAS